MVTSSTAKASFSESDFDCDSDGELHDFNSLKEIFGNERLDEIRREFLLHRHTQPKENRFNKIANALITASEQEEDKNNLETMSNCLKMPKLLADPSDEDSKEVQLQPSVKPKRQRIAEDQAKIGTATLVRGDTELYDSIPEADVEQVTKLKKQKMLNTHSARSAKIFDFLSKINCNSSRFDPNVLYNRLEEADDFELESQIVMEEILKKDDSNKDGDESSQFDVAAPTLERKATSDSTRAAIVNILINEEGLNIKNNIEDVSKHIKEIEAALPGMAPPWEILFRRLATAENLLAERRRIVDESNAPGPSNDDFTSVNVRFRRPSDEFLTEIMSEVERTAMRQILDMFPDVDPHFVLKELAAKQVEPDVLVDVLSRGGYPKFKDRLENQRKEERRQQFLDPNAFDLDEFLRTFSNDPEAYFADISKPVTQLYRYHALAQLQNDFPKWTEAFLTEHLEIHQNHYFPTLRSIQDLQLNKNVRSRRNRAFVMKHPRTTEVPFPDSIDELFFRELQFVRNYDDIKDHLEAKKHAHEQRLQEARSKNELRDCLCCFCDNVLPEEMLPCSDGTHPFCSTCVRRHAEEIIAQGRHFVPCISDGCDNVLSFSTLRNLLPPRLIDLLLRRNQMVEIRQAGIENVTSCPFCDFLLIMENDDDHVFSCRNPQCLRESCRLCKEPNHVPLKCNEVEKADETAMRTFIENRMADALIRSCPKCGQRIVKEDGCNKLKCPCGANICYVCRKNIGHDGEAYGHFGTKCPLHTAFARVHDDPVESAGEQAKREFLEAHPELKGRRDVELKKLMDDSSKRKDEGDDYDDEDEDESDDAGAHRRMHYIRPLLLPMVPAIRLRAEANAEDSSDDDSEYIVNNLGENLRRLERERQYATAEQNGINSVNEFLPTYRFDLMNDIDNGDQLYEARHQVQQARQRLRQTKERQHDQAFEAVTRAREFARKEREREMSRIRESRERKRLALEKETEHMKNLIQREYLNNVQPLAMLEAAAAGLPPFDRHVKVNPLFRPDPLPFEYIHPMREQFIRHQADDQVSKEEEIERDIIDFHYSPTNSKQNDTEKQKVPAVRPKVFEKRPSFTGKIVDRERNLTQIEQLRIQVNEAQIRLCNKQRTALRVQGGMNVDLNDQEYEEFDNPSFRTLMNNRDHLLELLRNAEKNALLRGVPEDQVYPTEENVLTNDDIEISIEEARKIVEQKQMFALQGRNPERFRRILQGPNPPKIDRDKIQNAVFQLQKMNNTILCSHVDRFIMIDVCRRARQIALEFSPNLNVELTLTEILSEAEYSDFLTTNALKHRCAEVLSGLIKDLNGKILQPFARTHFLIPRIQPLLRLDATASEQADVVVGERLPNLFYDRSNIDERKAAYAAFKNHEKETLRLNQQLMEAHNELAAVREQKRILKGREIDLIQSERRLLARIDERKAMEKQLTKRLNELRKPQGMADIVPPAALSPPRCEPFLEMKELDSLITPFFETADKELHLTEKLIAEPTKNQTSDFKPNYAQVSQSKVHDKLLKLQLDMESALTIVKVRFENHAQQSYSSTDEANRLRARLTALNLRLQMARDVLGNFLRSNNLTKEQYETKYLDIGKNIDQLRRELDLFESHAFEQPSKEDAPLIDFEEEESAISILFEKVQPFVPNANTSDVEIITSNHNTNRPVTNSFDMVSDMPGPSGWKPDQNETTKETVKQKGFECRLSLSKLNRNQSQQGTGLVQINVHLNSPVDAVNSAFINLIGDNNSSQAPVNFLPSTENETEDEMYPLGSFSK